MSVGYSVGKGDLDLMLGSLAIGTRNMVMRGQQVLSVLQAMTDAQLQNMGYSAAEVTMIRNTQSDIQTLVGIIEGTGTLATAHNFLSNLAQMYGTQ